MSDEGDTEEVVRIEQSVVKVNDGGSDLTDRFKYKVHALMGDFDPPSPDTDNENVDGNILSAMLTFPCKYDFNVVGKTDSDASSETFASLVQRIVTESTGDEKLQCRIKPRGQKYIKLTISATVESSAMISNVLNQIAKLDQTVMRF